MPGADSVEVVDLEMETDGGLLSKHLGKSLPSVPSLAAPPLLSQPRPSESSTNASSSAIASRATDQLSESQNMPTMFFKFQVSSELQKFMAQPPNTESCIHCLQHC